MDNFINYSANRQIGNEGENIAVKYIIDRGYKIIARNYGQKFGEIDIVAKSPDKTLIFVEVKSLIASQESRAMENVFHDSINPEDNLTDAKLIKLKKICQFYASKNPELIDESRGWQSDLIAVVLTKELKCCDVRYYENIAY